MTPGLVDAGHALATQGCTRVEVVPLFLGAGGHVRKDLPALLETLKSAHPQVQCGCFARQSARTTESSRRHRRPPRCDLPTRAEQRSME